MSRIRPRPGRGREPEAGARSRSSTPRLVCETLRLARDAAPRDLAVLLAAQLAGTLLVVAEVLLAREVLSDLLHADRAHGSVGASVPTVLLLGLATAALGVSQAVQSRQQRLLAELCLRHAQDRLLDVTCSVELTRFDDPGFHDAVARAEAGVMRVPTVIASTVALLRAVAFSLGAVVALVTIAPALAPLVLLVLAPAWLAAGRRGRLFYRFAHGRAERERERVYLARLLSDRDAAGELRAFELSAFLRMRHRRLWDERVDGLRRVANQHLAMTIAADLIASAIVVGTLLALIALTLADHVSLAGAGAAAAAILLLGQRLALAGSSAGALSESALYIEDYLALVALAPPDGAAARAPGPAPAVVAAEGVTFTYPGAHRPALRDVSLTLRAGEVVALVGANGSGKTTLAKLLTGLYLPDAGRVAWDGVDTATADRAALRQHATVIFQDFLRYSLPARDNIALGRHERFADDAAVRRAALQSGADADIVRLRESYDTMLGPAFQGGTDLSLGQWQRVALARAFFRDAPVVILDEPTAALDARAEHELFSEIRELLDHRAVLLISHRFSSVREADRIHVLREGRIVETGTHDELIELDGVYAELFELQAVSYR